MRKTIVAGLVCTAALGMTVLLSGCTNGVGDTIDLIKEAESAKQSVEQMVNGNDQQVSVGTAADPYYQPTDRLNMVDFSITYANSQFSAKWTVDTNYDALRVQIYADTDQSGEDGIKIGSFDSVSPIAEKTFQYGDLDEGTYYCYIKVTGTDGTPVIMYFAEPVTISIEDPEGALENIAITTDGTSVYLSWTAGDFTRYHAMLVAPDDTNNVLAETTVVEAQAKLDVPEGYTEVYAAVASYENSVMGPYRLYKVDTSAVTPDASNSSSTTGGDISDR